MEPLLTKDEAAAALCVSRRTIDRLKDLPRVRLTGRRIAFRPADLAAFAAARVSAPAAPADAERA
jgi:predicted DNA-binding transcriptional regulator AlpA